MGKSLISSCFPINLRRCSVIKLIFWDNGSTKLLCGSRKYVAGEIMFEFPDQMVSHAESFFIGRPIQALAMDDKLIPGQTYFVLPIDRFACKTLTTSSLSTFKSDLEQDRSKPIVDFTAASSPPPFEYCQGSNGRILIKVSPDFIINLIRSNSNRKSTTCCENSNRDSDICNTPELRKQYEQLVGSRDQIWSPKLETISEHKIRVSPRNFLPFNWKPKEKVGL